MRDPSQPFLLRLCSTDRPADELTIGFASLEQLGEWRTALTSEVERVEDLILHEMRVAVAWVGQVHGKHRLEDPHSRAKFVSTMEQLEAPLTLHVSLNAPSVPVKRPRRASRASPAPAGALVSVADRDEGRRLSLGRSEADAVAGRTRRASVPSRLPSDLMEKAMGGARFAGMDCGGLETRGEGIGSPSPSLKLGMDIVGSEQGHGATGLGADAGTKGAREPEAAAVTYQTGEGFGTSATRRRREFETSATVRAGPALVSALHCIKGAVMWKLTKGGTAAGAWPDSTPALVWRLRC